MAKKKNTAKPAKNGSKPQNGQPASPPSKTKKKKAFVIREEHPGMIVPLVAVVLVLFVMGAGDAYGFIARVPALLCGGAAILLFLTIAPIYYVKLYLYPKGLRAILALVSVLTLGGCGVIVWLGSWTQPPVYQVSVNASDPLVETKLESGRYSLLLQGAFREDEEGKEKKGSYNVEGSYDLLLSTSDGALNKPFTGTFKEQRKKRKLSKKKRGYQEIRRTIDFDTFRNSKNGEIQLRLNNISSTLEDRMEVEIYKSGLVVYFLMFLAIPAVLLANFVDSIIRASRITSLLGYAVAAAFGFSIYFYFESSPIVHYSTMAIDLLTGGLLGVLAAAGLSTWLNKTYASIALKNGISI